MYKQLGYSVYRTVIEYYSASNGEPDEDAYGKLSSLAESPGESRIFTLVLQTEIFNYFNKHKRMIFVGLNILNSICNEISFNLPL